MTEALLADDVNPTPDATTTQGGTTEVDQAPAPEQPTKQVEETADETKTAEPKAEPEKKGEEAKPEEPTKRAPELYEFEVPDGMPEGFEKDEAVFESLEKVSRELDLTQEQAQALVDQVWPVMHRRTEEQQAEVHEKWISDAKADKEILKLGEAAAGSGPAFEKALATAKKAVKAYGSDGLQELLNSPIGSHPEVVRFLVKVGATVSEDKFVGGGQRGESIDLNDTAAVARKLYPSSQPTS